VDLGTWIEPQQVFARFFGESPTSFWLDSGINSTGGFSYMGDAEANATIESCGPRDDHDLFERFEASHDVDTTDPDLDGLGFRLGWVGWFSYEFGARLMGAKHAPVDSPDAAFFFVHRALVFDHAQKTVSALLLVEETKGVGGGIHGHSEWFARVRRDLLALLRDAEGMLTVSSRGAEETARLPTTWRHSDSEYLALIDECQRVIARGEAYQLCLTNTVRIGYDSTGAAHTPMATYLRLREINPSHHGGYVRIGGTALLSASPERFLRIFPDRTVETSPIKGTRARGKTRVDDERLRRELEESPKEQAENLMIVDLTRNDLARVCVVGSVVVTRLLALESYSHVHQLVSTVRGVLQPGVSFAEVLASTFPAGSMTGAPKCSAINTLFNLEGGPRGIYSGVFGYVGIDGSVDLAMVIRSIVIDAAGASIGTGGGITALSHPHEELEEIHLKAKALLRAVTTVNA